MINVSNFTKTYGAHTAVSDVSFCVPTNSITGLVGLNGAGKTTLLKAIAGVHYADSGTIEVNGINVIAQNVKNKSQIGFVADQSIFFPEFIVYEYLLYEACIVLQHCSRDSIHKRVHELISICSLEDVVFKRIKTLSKGYCQRLALARAIMNDPPVLLLDEPTSGLDPKQVVEVRTLIQEMSKNKTIIISTHVMQEISALCSTIMVLHKGGIVAFGSEMELCKKASCKTIEDSFLYFVSTHEKEESI